MHFLSFQQCLASNKLFGEVINLPPFVSVERSLWSECLLCSQSKRRIKCRILPIVDIDHWFWFYIFHCRWTSWRSAGKPTAQRPVLGVHQGSAAGEVQQTEFAVQCDMRKSHVNIRKHLTEDNMITWYFLIVSTKCVKVLKKIIKRPLYIMMLSVPKANTHTIV